MASPSSPVSMIRDFLKLEAASGIILVATAVLAMIIANSPLDRFYDALLNLPVSLQFGALILAKPLLLWVNDGLMAVFFLLMGLEIKRELVVGELSSWNKASLPGYCALGGMIVPALIYYFLNAHDTLALRGWAIPTATDIAFAMGVLSLLGSRVPGALKVFLLALAIIDDLGAIIIIAVFYTADLSFVSLGLAGLGLLGLLGLNLFGVRRLAPYLLIGVFIWVCVLKSGVHATLAGVAVAMFIPVRAVPGGGETESPLERLEHMLLPWVSFAIMPSFAFANAGVSFAGVTADDLTAPLSVGIALGLFVGKQIGVFGIGWLAVKIGLCRKPEGLSWASFYGVSLLAGIGFTMSLFIGSLAFDDLAHATAIRLGVFAGSLVSAVTGYFWLRAVTGRAVAGGAGA
ncbi:Na+/H+ antiporter NhaA [Hypericibacter sp.]|uniref:Na+/H+ antiporter NhaA n=1 Tax=Hypericibacter sp. TaxID=2705401 RepID=UPI003D6D151A